MHDNEDRPSKGRPVRDWRDEQVISGFNAVMAVLNRRPGAVLRLFFTASQAPRFGFACKALAEDHKIYRVVEASELEKLCKSPHHEGVVAITDGRVILEPGAETIAAWNAEKALVLVFDQVRNAHNMGAMVRTAAFLGVRDIVLDQKAFAALSTPSAARIAEGGLEEVRLWQVESVGDFLTRYKSRLWVVGTDQHAPVELASVAVDARRSAGACLLVMGSEEEGLSPEMRAICDVLCAIPGSGAVESLNVVQAAAICLYVLAGKPAPAEALPPRKPKVRIPAPPRSHGGTKAGSKPRKAAPAPRGDAGDDAPKGKRVLRVKAPKR